MFHRKLRPVEKIDPWLSEIIWYNVTSAREPKACLHASGERRGNRVTKSRVTRARKKWSRVYE